MKKINLLLIVLIVTITSNQIVAQEISTNYTRNFIPSYEAKIKNNKLVPQTESQIMVTYTQNLKNSPIVLNFSIASSNRKPPMPRFIKYPNPQTLNLFAIDNNIQWDEARFSKSKTTSIDLLTGVGYKFPHKKGSSFEVTANLDFGISFNNKQTLDYYLEGTKTGSLSIPNSQVIVNPYIKLRYALTSNFGVNLNAGYSNLGGVNSGLGLVYSPRPWFVKCLVCGRWHRLGHCKSKIKDGILD